MAMANGDAGPELLSLLQQLCKTGLVRLPPSTHPSSFLSASGLPFLAGAQPVSRRHTEQACCYQQMRSPPDTPPPP